MDKIYKTIYLENEYVRIGVLPEIGGRIFEAVDKSKRYKEALEDFTTALVIPATMPSAQGGGGGGGGGRNAEAR